MATQTSTITLQQFLRLPEEKPALEYIDGVVTQKVSPKGRHSVLQRAFIDCISRAVAGERRAEVFPELRVTFGGESRVPDLAVYRQERVPLDDSGEVADEFGEPPDIAIEIVSPEQSVNQLVRKCLWYIDQGVQIALLVDPDDRSVVRFSPGAEPQALRGAQPVDLGDVVPGFELTVQDLFDSLRRR